MILLKVKQEDSWFSLANKGIFPSRAKFKHGSSLLRAVKQPLLISTTAQALHYTTSGKAAWSKRQGLRSPAVPLLPPHLILPIFWRNLEPHLHRVVSMPNSHDNGWFFRAVLTGLRKPWCPKYCKYAAIPHMTFMSSQLSFPMEINNLYQFSATTNQPLSWEMSDAFEVSYPIRHSGWKQLLAVGWQQ